MTKKSKTPQVPANVPLPMDNDYVEVPCIDGTENHEWVISDENDSVSYCSRCGVPEY